MKRFAFRLFLMTAILSWMSACELVDVTEDEPQKPMLVATPLQIDFVPGSSSNTITIQSNVAWEIELEEGLETDWTKGYPGKSTVKVTAAPEGESMLRVISVPEDPEEEPIVCEVKVIYDGSTDPEPEPEPMPQELIYYDNLDGGTPPSSNSWIDTWTGFINATGSGAANVEYFGWSFQSRDSYASRDYAGASGANAFYSNAPGAYVGVRNIVIPSGASTFKLSFGSLGDTNKGSFTANEDIVLNISNENGLTRQVNYRRSSSTQQWALCEVVFTITGGLPQSLALQFNASAKNIRIDDIRLETSSETPDCEISFGGSSGENTYPWAELPETVTSNQNYKYITHYATTVRSNQTVRNYVSCYDVSRHNPMWVAHIHHSCYYEGGWSRSTPDPWRPDPELSESEQSIIYPYDWDNWYSGIRGWPTDSKYYWSATNFSYPTRANGSDLTITKGHMLRSADRGGDGAEINIQTFYPTNISPELYLHTNTWEIVENALSDRWTCSDTTYVVTGCYYGDDEYELIDASSWGSPTDGKSKTCIMPVARYRVILKTRSGNTGKPVAECSADELISIGFWFPQAFNGQKVYEETDKSQWIFSVADIEKKIGGEFSFFPTVPEEVKQQRNLSDWGL